MCQTTLLKLKALRLVTSTVCKTYASQCSNAPSATDVKDYIEAGQSELRRLYEKSTVRLVDTRS